MKIFKVFTLALMILSAGLFITSCDETTSPTSVPEITSVSPGSGKIGDNITIKGTGFGSATDNGIVYVGDVKVTGVVGSSDYIKWTDTEIIIKVPANAVMCTTLYVNNGTSNSNKFPFTLIGTAVSTLAAPGKAMATSLTGTETSGAIRVKWAASAAETNADFYGYKLEITEASTGTKNTVSVAGKTVKVYDFTGLKSGSVYDIKIYTLLNNANYSANSSNISWAPALRFTDILLYESASASPSGLQLFDAALGKPVPLTIASGSKWDICLDTKGTTWNIGSPTKVSYTITSPRKTTIYMPADGSWTGGKSLDDSYDTDLLSAGVTEAQIPFEDKYENYVFAVKTKDGNFAKILLKKVNGTFMQGTSPNRFLTVDVSYQKVANVPYAF
jgi:hypothetical protein